MYSLKGGIFDIVEKPRVISKHPLTQINTQISIILFVFFSPFIYRKFPLKKPIHIMTLQLIIPPVFRPKHIVFIGIIGISLFRQNLLHVLRPLFVSPVHGVIRGSALYL